MKKIYLFLDRYTYALASCAYLLTIGLFRRKNRTFLNEIIRHFGYYGKPKPSSLPALSQVEVSELVREDVPIQVREPAWADGNVSALELIVIAKLVATYHPTRILEIGTFDGRTTLNLAANSGSEAQVYTLDLPRNALADTSLSLAPQEDRYVKKDISGARYRDTDCAANIHQLYGDSATYDFASLRHTLDFIFIDASHSYEYVLNDTRLALDLLRRDGNRVIIWHDYGGWPGVTQAVDEIFCKASDPHRPRWVKGTNLAVLVLT